MNADIYPAGGYERSAMFSQISAMLPFYRTFGVPTNFVSEWGERRQLSPNDACVIQCDLLAEREHALIISQARVAWSGVRCLSL